MSDRDGYWDSDWDPEVGIDPPDDSYDDNRCSYDHDESFDDERHYIVFCRVLNDTYALLDDQTWAKWYVGREPEPTGVLAIDQKWIAERLASIFNCHFRRVSLCSSHSRQPKQKLSYEELKLLKENAEEEAKRQQEEKRRLEQDEKERRERENIESLKQCALERYKLFHPSADMSKVSVTIDTSGDTYKVTMSTSEKPS